MAKPKHAGIHVALLRGINVGGRNKLPMKSLAALFAEVGCDDVQTYIQSGNVVFRASAAVEHVAPFVGFIYTTLVLWFADGVSKSPVAMPPLRPWYRHKRGLCFADVLRTAQRVLAGVDVLDLARDSDNLRECPEPRAHASFAPKERAAQGRNGSLSSAGAWRSGMTVGLSLWRLASTP
jgi:hypothetical protein